MKRDEIVLGRSLATMERYFYIFPLFSNVFTRRDEKMHFANSHTSPELCDFSRKIMHFVACQVWSPQTTEYQECELTSLTSSASLVA